MATATRADSTLTRALGVLLFVVALLLSIPGVRAVRAGEPDMTPVGVEDLRGREQADLVVGDRTQPAAPGPEACGDPSSVTVAEHKRAQLAVQLPPKQAGDPAGDGPTGFILLNNRGYNYGPPAEPDPAQ
jgi:hypothetical protein